MSADVESSAGWVERWLAEPFEHEGWRGIFRRAWVGSLVSAMLWALFAVTVGGLGGQMSRSELLWAIAINAGCVSGALGVLWWVAIRDVARFEAWEAKGCPSADASLMLMLVLNAPVKWVSWGVGTYVALFPSLWAWFIATVEPLGFAIILVLAGFLGTTLVVWPVGVLVGELGARPVIARIYAEFPHLPAPEIAMSLRTKTILPVPALTLTTGVVVGGLVGLLDERAEQIGAAIIISVVLSGGIAVFLRMMVTEAALRPVDDLIEGVQRISAGDLESRVPITGADELAVLGRAINEMTALLAAHDAEMRASRARIVAASDESRRMVERDLHDGAQQYLVLLELKLGMLTKAVADDPEALALTGEVREDLDRALTELRDLAHGIYPAVLESDGLPAALEAAAQRSSLPATVDAAGVGRYAQELEAAVYFCCLEALQNAAKHAGDGAKVTVRLSQNDGHLRFEVGDDGVGYDVGSIGPSAGLQNMADRIGALGGELTIESERGSGTTVRGVVPIEATR